MNNHELSPHIEGIVFDCDGTLADTMPAHWLAWNSIATKYGLHFPMERFYALGGVPAREIVQMLCREQGLTLDAMAIAKEKEAAYEPSITKVVAIEVVVAVAQANAGRIPMAVASGGTKPIIEKVLRHLGIRDLFQAVVTSEDVVKQKPAPDIFLEAARRIGVPPEKCRGYEDTDLGMQAIRSAGMEAIDVRWLLKKSRIN